MSDPSPSRRELLEAARDRLTGLLGMTEGSAAAALSKELRAVLVELDAMPAVGGARSKQDELKARRDARLAEAATRARPAEAK